MDATARDLPDDLALPLASGVEWWYWLGGRPAVDLVNTLRERWRRRVETLVTPDDLGRWLVRAELLPAPAAVTRAVLDDARDLREAIDLGVQAAVDSEVAPHAAIEEIDGWLADACAPPHLALGADGRPSLCERPADDAVRGALAAVALDAARMLGTPAQAARIRICASETCSARFYDRSPAARRRWCSMASCGNEAKARRHRARARAMA
ncbi:MAG TPA: CGNR zinc finger domain-containing protein [Solirubrobacteraceae bacterium]